MYMCFSVCHEYTGAHRSQKRKPDLLELERQAVVSSLHDYWEPNWGPPEQQQVFLTVK